MPTEPQTTFAARLTKARGTRRLTQADVSARIGVSQSYLSKWEAGTKRPSPAHLRALLDLYGVSGDERLGLWELLGARADEQAEAPDGAGVAA